LAKTATIERAHGQPGPEESELIRRILAGERELYYALIEPYQRMTYLSALAVLRNEADAEDCAQEALLKGLRHLKDFRGESKFGSWLVRITLNEAKMKVRKLRPGQYESLDEADSEDSEYVPRILSDWREIPSEALERKEVREVLHNAMQRLPKIYREVFFLRDVQNQDIATTAQILDVTEMVVKTRLLRARLQMRDMIAPLLKQSNVFSRLLFRKGANPWR